MGGTRPLGLLLLLLHAMRFAVLAVSGAAGLTVAQPHSALPNHAPPAAHPQFGEEVRGNNTASNADGKTPASAFVFPYPYTGAAKLWFTVTVVVGGTRSSASPIYGPVIMGALSNCKVAA